MLTFRLGLDSLADSVVSGSSFKLPALRLAQAAESDMGEETLCVCVCGWYYANETAESRARTHT